MSSPENQSTGNRGIDWLAIARIFLVQVLVLLALASAGVGYINWSSNAVWAEFLRAGDPPKLAPGPAPQSTPVQTVKGQGVCPRKG
jgi:hypothetical protein